jgi:hypothetical protein
MVVRCPVVDLNVANFITVGLISVFSVIALKYLLGLIGITPAWL